MFYSRLKQKSEKTIDFSNKNKRSFKSYCALSSNRNILAVWNFQAMDVTYPISSCFVAFFFAGKTGEKIENVRIFFFFNKSLFFHTQGKSLSKRGKDRERIERERKEEIE